jgi:hypothetical protein
MMCPTEHHVLEWDGKCTDPRIDDDEGKRLQALHDAKVDEIQEHINTISNIEKTEQKQRYQLQTEFVKTKT